ncbi:MAG: zincin-like metallopeptidase domain-containing protein [Bacteroidota bacterium]
MEKKNSPQDIYQQVTDLIIQKLEQGIIPWQKPWSSYGLPKNYITGKEYRGINALLLHMLLYEYPYFLTFKQAKDLGGSVMKGSRASIVTYWNWLYYDRNGNRVTNPRPDQIKYLEKRAFLRYFNVFNISQVEGIEWKLPALQSNSHLGVPVKAARMVSFLKAKLPDIRVKGDKAYYVPAEDCIIMPDYKLFVIQEAFYATLFHEIIHSTGHLKRLNRDGITLPTHFGSYDYGKEELIAEMGASFLCQEVGILNDTLANSAAYLQSWLTTIKQDKRLLVTAAAQAQKAVDWLLGSRHDEDHAHA